MIDQQIRVALADDHPVARAGLRSILGAASETELVGEAENGLDALSMARNLKPDVLLLDIQMPKMSGVEVAQKLRAEQPETKIIALSAFDDREYIYGILSSGAAGYLTKDEANDVTLLAAIHFVLGEDGPFISDRLAGQLVRMQVREVAFDELMASLSDREQEVLQLVAKGLNNNAIGEALFIAPHTVKNHISHIRDKLGVRTRAELIAWAWEHRVVMPA